MSADPNAPTPPETPPETPETPPPPPPTAEYIAAQVKAALAEGTGTIEEKLDAALAAHAASTAQPSETPPDPTPDDDLAALMENPKAAMRATVDEYVRGNVAPLLAGHMNVTRDAILETQIRPQVESKFGAETWTKVHTALLAEGSAFNQLTPDNQANPKVIQRAVQNLIADDLFNDEAFDGLVQARTKAREERAAQAAPGGLGNSGPNSGEAPQLSAEAKDSLAQLNRAGVELSEAEILEASALGGDWASWKPHLDKQKAKAKAK